MGIDAIGIGEYEVAVYGRGGAQRVARLDRVDSLSFTRRLDDTGECSVTCVSEEWADLIHPWQHEIHIFRSGSLVWCGPVRDKSYVPENGQVKITARDLFSWFDFRVPHDELDFVDEDMANVFVAIMESALKPDKSPNIVIDKTPANIPTDFYHDPELPKIAATMLRDLADSGVDFTTINRTIYVRNEEMDKESIGTLYSKHFATFPEIKESGEMATLLLLTGAGGDFHSQPDAVDTREANSATAAIAVGKWDKDPFGLLETIVDATSLFDAEDKTALEKSAKSRYELLRYPRLYLDSVTLHKSAPVAMSSLIPGRRLTLSMDIGSIPLITEYRIQSVEVSVSNTAAETISLTLTSVGDYSRDAVLQ
jgi:hypothetical protein